MEIADLLATEPASIAPWAYRVYERIRRQPLPDEEFRALFERGIEVSLRRHDMVGLHASLGLAANYYASIGDQFGCLPYFEETMQRVLGDPEARAIVLQCTHDILIGNS